MGKCSGLKGGGHHRRALDVAEKKKKDKAARKQEQAASGKRAVILKEILTEIDADCDLYMDAAICDASSGNRQQSQQQQQQHQGQQQPSQYKKQNGGGKGLPDLCRPNFRNEACRNKRCKFSHEHSIAEALSNVMSGTNENYGDDGPATLPALRHLPGILADNNSGKKKSGIRKRRMEDEDRPLSALENALREGSSAADRIVSCLDSDRDVLALGSTCWHLFTMVLSGDGCPDVQRRKYRARERRLERRNSMLLTNKSLAGGLRYAVSYFESNKTKKKAKENNRSLRPVLVFDYENPDVYKAFRESGRRKNGLERSLANNCKVVD